MHSKVLVVFTVIDKSRESYFLDTILDESSVFNGLLKFILKPYGSYSLVAEYKAVALEAGVRFSLAALFSTNLDFSFQRGALQC